MPSLKRKLAEVQETLQKCKKWWRPLMMSQKKQEYPERPHLFRLCSHLFLPHLQYQIWHGDVRHASWWNQKVKNFWILSGLYQNIKKSQMPFLTCCYPPKPQLTEIITKINKGMDYYATCVEHWKLFLITFITLSTRSKMPKMAEVSL